MCSTEIKTKHLLCIHSKRKILQVVDEQRDVGVTVCNNNIKPGSHIKHITAKANQLIGLIKRRFKSRIEKTIKTLCDSIIRLVLEYASPAWNHYYHKRYQWTWNKTSKVSTKPQPTTSGISFFGTDTTRGVRGLNRFTLDTLFNRSVRI